MQPSPKEIRQARAFLQNRGIRTSDIAPKDFAAAHREAGSKTFGETLKLIASLLMGGQGEGPAPRAAALAKKAA
ncbi:MAG: hypothetical protein KF895_03010 [Parvibaculum sp.]|nr:hypothetical protein [Parvibaculum sp.]